MNKYIITQEVLRLKDDIEEYFKTLDNETNKDINNLYKAIKDFIGKTGLQDE